MAPPDTDGDKPKAPKPSLWRRLINWTVGGIGVKAALILSLSALLIVTVALGTVSDGDVAAAFGSYPFRGTAPALLLTLTDDGHAVPVCEASFGEVVTSAEPEWRVVNRFGQRMKVVVSTVEWFMGLFFQINLPTSVAVMQDSVHDPGFGVHEISTVRLRNDDRLKRLDAVLREPTCELAVSCLLERGDAVCEPDLFEWDPVDRRILRVRLTPRCLTLGNATNPTFAPPVRPSEFLTRMKMHLGILDAERIDGKAGN